MNETSPTRIYNDGPCFPRTTLAVESEKAYRDWFAKTATGVPAWTRPDVAKQIEAAEQPLVALTAKH